MSNFLGDVYSKTSGMFGKDVGGLLDPMGAQKHEKDLQDEEKKRNDAIAAQRDALQTKLNSNIRDVMNLRASSVPTSQDQAVAARKAIAQQRSRKGRESTILTGDLLG